MDYPENREFTSTYHNNDVTALKAISRELGLVENQSFTIVISSMKDQTYFDALVPKLSKFPVLSMSKAKAPHSLDIFPWQSNVAQMMINRYLTAGAWIDRIIAHYDVR